MLSIRNCSASGTDACTEHARKELMRMLSVSKHQLLPLNVDSAYASKTCQKNVNLINKTVPEAFKETKLRKLAEYQMDQNKLLPEKFS